MAGPRFKLVVYSLAAFAVMLLVACGGASKAEEPPSEPASGALEAAPSAAASPPASCTSSVSHLEPDDGIYFGVNLDWENDSPADYTKRLGHAPAAYVLFQEFPLSEEALGYVYYIAEQVKAENGMLMLTLEPHSGLDSVTTESANRLAGQLAGVNTKGVPVYLRFAHEMNGSWYAWSQQPAEYVRAFREVATAVHAQAP